MSKTTVSRKNDVARLLRLAELEATDERSRQECMDEMTDPGIIGLNPEDATVVAEAIRSDMIRQITAEDFIVDDDADDDDDDDDAGDKPESEPEDEMVEDVPSPKGSDDEVKDEVEFEDDSDPFAGSDEGTKLGEGFGFPDEEEDVIDEEGEAAPIGPVGPEGLEGPGAPEGAEGLLPIPSSVGDISLPDEGGPMSDEGVPSEGAFGEGGEVIPIDPEGGPIILALPDGSTMELKLTKEVLAAIRHQEEVEAMSRERMVANPSGQVSMDDFRMQRSAQRQALRQILAQEDDKSEDLKAEDIGTGRPLGEDTSHSGDGKGGGKKFQMEDATHGVANPGNTEVHSTMTLSNSEGNSLRTDPGFAPNPIYTMNPADLMMNANAKELKRFSPETEGYATRTIDGSDTPDPIPTTGMGPDFWGWDKGFQAFDVPTQLDTTRQRFPQVQASEWNKRVITSAMNRECMGCYDPQGVVEPVECEDCGSTYALCQACVGDGHCPTCASRNAENANYNMREAGLNWDAYCGTSKDRSEVCEDTRGDDPNGDGGFHTSDKMGGAPKGKNARDMNVDAGQFEKEASRKMDELARQNQALHIQMARLVKATEVANELVTNGQIAPDEVGSQIDRWMADNMTIPALENFRTLARELGRRDFQTRISQAGNGGMERTASPNRIRPASLSFNPNPTREVVAYGGGELAEALSEMMKSNLPSKEDFDERTGVRLR